MPTPTYEPIQTITNTGGAVITFSNIPQTYTDIVFSCRLQWQQSSDARAVLNNTGYFIYSNIVSLVPGPGITGATRGTNNLTAGFWSNGVTEGQGGELILSIFDYASTSYYKATLSRSSSVGNAVYSCDMIAGLFQSTDPITSVSFYRDGYNPPQYTSSVTMYGITYGS